ncbi:MAG: hypothetical protein EXS00_04115 [Phycisphaerales bacterium]|nr:hypothetical protein [Phycisphaerales bacterium]
MSLLERLDIIDRRWIFLLMALAVSIPIIVSGMTGKTFPESATPTTQTAFDTIESLPAGSKVLLAFDFDPASAGELQPMAIAFTRHVASRDFDMYFATLWAPAPPLIIETIKSVIVAGHPHMVYGVDYVNLGFQAGNESVLKVISTDFKQSFTVDARGTPVTSIPMMADIKSTEDFDLIINLSAGYPGCKEWVQYIVSPTLSGDHGTELKLVAGVTGVQAPQMVPYWPRQLKGMLAAIKGAAEYEALVNASLMEANPGLIISPVFNEAQRRMAPQLFGHLLMVSLIILGNVIHFSRKRAGGTAVKALRSTP